MIKQIHAICVAWDEILAVFTLTEVVRAKKSIIFKIYDTKKNHDNILHVTWLESAEVEDTTAVTEEFSAAFLNKKLF